MDYRQALKETMFRFGLKGVDLASRSGVKDAQISAFRSGKKDLRLGTFEAIINAMPVDAQLYFYRLVRNEEAETLR